MVLVSYRRDFGKAMVQTFCYMLQRRGIGDVERLSIRRLYELYHMSR